MQHFLMKCFRKADLHCASLRTGTLQHATSITGMTGIIGVTGIPGITGMGARRWGVGGKSRHSLLLEKKIHVGCGGHVSLYDRHFSLCVGLSSLFFHHMGCLFPPYGDCFAGFNLTKISAIAHDDRYDRYTSILTGRRRLGLDLL